METESFEGILIRHLKRGVRIYLFLRMSIGIIVTKLSRRVEVRRGGNGGNSY
jgi:hypothetical protein